jgi:hypothetical protein
MDQTIRLIMKLFFHNYLKLKIVIRDFMVIHVIHFLVRPRNQNTAVLHTQLRKHVMRQQQQRLRQPVLRVQLKKPQDL